MFKYKVKVLVNGVAHDVFINVLEWINELEAKDMEEYELNDKIEELAIEKLIKIASIESL